MFIINGKTIYINSRTGSFSFSNNILDYDGYIDYDEVIREFNVKTLNICICISNSCNLKCDYCFNLKKDNKIMKSSEAIRLIDSMIKKFPNCDKYFVDLSGNGEPLLNLKTIIEINAFCKVMSNKLNKEILVSFVSNGVLLTKEIATLLQNEGILFGVSIDGNKKNHDDHRKDQSGQPTYNKIINNISSIKNRDYIGCAVTITNDVFDLVKTVDELALLFSTISIKPVRDLQYGLKIESIYKWIEEYKKLSKRILNDCQKNDISLLKRFLNGDDYFGKFIYRVFLEQLTLNRCDRNISRFCFDNNGKLFGCPPASEFKQLEIKKIDYRKSFKQQIEQLDHVCKNCSFVLYCGGECAIEIILNGKKNDAMCLFKTNLIKEAMYLKLEIEMNHKKQYNEIINFCLEKQKRYSKNNDLYDFLKLNPHLNFIEGKRKYDQLNKKY